MIYSGAPSTNYGVGDWRLMVGTTSSEVYRSLVRFDLSSIPAGTRIQRSDITKGSP